MPAPDSSEAIRPARERMICDAGNDVDQVCGSMCFTVAVTTKLHVAGARCRPSRGVVVTKTRNDSVQADGDSLPSRRH